MTNSIPPSPHEQYDFDPKTGAVLIPLNGKKFPGRFALVDPEDASLVFDMKWCPVSVTRNNNIYASGKRNGRNVYMHRIILGLTDRRVQVDHINHDGLDNRRCNLRVASPSQNTRNSSHRVGGSSQYKGVVLYKRTGKWKASICFNYRTQHLGYFESEQEAAEAYDGAALMLFGSYACLNFPDEGEVAS